MNQDVFVIIEHLQGKVADISYIMLAAAGKLAQDTGGRCVAVLLGHNAQGLASSLAADQVLYLDDLALAEFTSDAYQRALTGLLSGMAPRAALFGSTTIGADIASVLSARLGLPLVSSCLNFGNEGKFLSKICGGKIMAEGDLPGPTTLVTMIPGGFNPEEGRSAQPSEVIPVAVPELDGLRVKLVKYIEPEDGDVDISKETVLIAIGRGIQAEDNIGLAKELAELLGGEVCASRPVVDQGWLPTTRLVGKSGKSVKPKLYLAIGISGAPEHIEGMIDSDTIIAINMDPAAPIFDVAQYGIEFDLFDLIDVLIEQVEEGKLLVMR